MMKIAAVFLTVLVYGVLSSDDCPLPESSIYEPSSFQQCIYNSKNGKANYDSSQMFCSSANGQLLKINNAYENSIAVNILYEEYGSGQLIRLGLRNINGVWKWSDGTTAKYLRFAPGNPVNGFNCVALNTTDLLWYSSDCQMTTSFSCLFPTIHHNEPTPPETGGRCRPGWSYFADTNQCYWIGGNATYYDALKECTVLGANLASLHSLGESNFILGLTITTPNYCDGDPYAAMRTWIGGYYNDDKWVWADGTKYDFDYVYDDADSSGSLAIVTNTDCNTFTLWNSYEPSSKMLYFVCKMQAF